MKADNNIGVNPCIGDTPIAIEKSEWRNPIRSPCPDPYRPGFKWSSLGRNIKMTIMINQLRLKVSLVLGSNILNKSVIEIIFYFIFISSVSIYTMIDKKGMFYINILFGLLLFSREELRMMSNTMAMSNLV